MEPHSQENLVKNLVMMSVYDLTSVQTLGKGEGGRASGISPSGKEYNIAEVKFAFQAPRSFRLLITWPPGLLAREREKKKKQSLTWITGKELEREIYNNGDQFRWKKNVKIITLGEKMRKASGYQGENERQ